VIIRNTALVEATFAVWGVELSLKATGDAALIVKQPFYPENIKILPISI
jgi:hypothetical protein